MKYSPPNENTKPLMITVFLTTVSVMSLLFASRILQFKWLFQLLFICFATAAIQVFLKYVLTKYEYQCEDGCILIYKSLGKKQTLIGNIPLEYSSSCVMNAREFEEHKDEFPFKDTFTYTRNYKTDNVYYYITSVTGGGALIKMELCDSFAEYVNKCIDITAKGKENNDEI